MQIITATRVHKPGLYQMSAEDYFADPCPAPSLTQSVAKILLERTPLHAAIAHPRLSAGASDDEEADAERYDSLRAIGNAAHSILIGRGKEIVEGDFRNWQTKEAKAFRAAAEAAGKVAILSKHLIRAAYLATAARTQLDAAGLRSAFRDGHGEVVIAWQEDGLWFRSMIDWMVSPAELFDLKTTGSAIAPHTIGIKAAEDSWDLQAAMQERGLDVLFPETAGRRRFRFVPIENRPPYGLIPVELPESWLMMGRKRLAVAMRIWRTCMESGQWPGFPVEVVRPEYPSYIENRWLNREIGEFSDTLARAS